MIVDVTVSLVVVVLTDPSVLPYTTLLYDLLSGADDSADLVSLTTLFQMFDEGSLRMLGERLSLQLY